VLFSFFALCSHKRRVLRLIKSEEEGLAGRRGGGSEAKSILAVLVKWPHAAITNLCVIERLPRNLAERCFVLLLHCIPWGHNIVDPFSCYRARQDNGLFRCQMRKDEHSRDSRDTWVTTAVTSHGGARMHTACAAQQRSHTSHITVTRRGLPLLAAARASSSLEKYSISTLLSSTSAFFFRLPTTPAPAQDVT
jgi:hypothetical protein